MLKKTLCVMLVLCTVSLADIATQTDWSGEAGVPGPVTNWGSNYDTCSLVSTTITGVIRLPSGFLLATPIEHTVDGYFDGATSVYATDVDGDGDTDVLGAAFYADEITWWENTDGTGTAWAEHTVDGDFDGANLVYARDVDGDGDTDVLGAASILDDITWWENTDGTGTAWTEHTIDGEFDRARSVYATDVDGDGDTDVLGASGWADDITWWENTDGTGIAWTEHTIDGNFDYAASVYAADVDGDGDTDVLGAAYIADDITWWENTDGTGTAWTEHTVDGYFDGATTVYATDVDGDGDTDVLGAAYIADDITWWENTDGTGTAWTEHTVDGNVDGAYSVYATDVDGDGDTDVLGTAWWTDDIIWWENSDSGAGIYWTKHTVDGNFDSPESVYAADVDGDGYTDVLGAAWNADDITWWNLIGYMGEGNLESSILDAGLVGTWDFFSSNSTEPTGTSVAFQFRSSIDAGDMGAWSDTVFSSGTFLSGILADSTPYLQYRAILQTDDHLITPQLEDVWFIYTAYVNIGESSSGEITSWKLLAPENPSYGYLSALITVPEPGFVELRVYDVTGRVIAGASQEFSTGTHSVIFQGLAEGVYFCVMSADDYTAIEQVIVLR